MRFHLPRILPLTFAAIVLTHATAIAQGCKTEDVVQAGEPYISRTLGAFPSSLLAWRRAVAQKYGDGWNTWFRAQDRKIDCAQKSIDGAQRWVCTRSAKPCTAGGSASAPPPITFTRTLRPGDEGEEVRQLQQLLAEYGYDVKIDGKYSRGTERAIREFQKKERLTVDGNFGPATQAKLLGMSGGSGSAAGTGSSSSGIKFTRTLRRGDEGEDVRQLQDLLNKRGYSVKVDGKYGTGTQSAIRDFQQKQGLPTDGNFGPQTQAKLTS